jgi:hypothetical protein
MPGPPAGRAPAPECHPTASCRAVGRLSSGRYRSYGGSAARAATTSLSGHGVCGAPRTSACSAAAPRRILLSGRCAVGRAGEAGASGARDPRRKPPAFARAGSMARGRALRRDSKPMQREHWLGCGGSWNGGDRQEAEGASLFRPCMGPPLSRTISSLHCSFSVRLRDRFSVPT